MIEQAVILDRPVGMPCSELEPYDFGAIIPGACLVDVDPAEWRPIPAPREHRWIRHPKVELSSCGSCGRHWWHEQPKPTDPCTGEREVNGASS